MAALELLFSVLTPACFGFAFPAGESISLELSPDASLALKAEWSGIADSMYKLHQQREFAAFFEFKPAAASKKYGADEIRALLPKEPVAVGPTWRQRGLSSFIPLRSCIWSFWERRCAARNRDQTQAEKNSATRHANPGSTGSFSIVSFSVYSRGG